MKKREKEIFKPGDIVLHVKSKGIYEVIAVATHEKTGENLVIYQREMDTEVFARSFDEFHDGRFIQV